MKAPTQKQLVLDHLRNKGSISSMEAFELYDITRLAAVIFDLRADGYRITAEDETSKRGKHYARYRLVPKTGEQVALDL